jgi:apolipoprotein N-acyltransferase
VAPVRASEYGIPVFRVASSGISQFVDRSGRVIASADFPGSGEEIFGPLSLARAGHLPLDRLLAPLATDATVLIVFVLLIMQRKQRLAARLKQENPSVPC